MDDAPITLPPMAGSAPPAPDLAGLVRRFADSHSLFFDIGTLRERQFTGIPNVAANLAREILAAGLPCQFFIGENVIRPDYVRFLLETGGGAWFGYHHQLGETVEGKLLARVAAAPGRSVGLFPAEKPFHRLFDLELQVLHDFSTLATPYFHVQATNELHGANLLADIASNSLNFCVSASTAEYLKRLCPAAGRVAVAHNGVRWPERFAGAAESLFGRLSFEPYVVILGTMEPRKNLEIVFRALGQDRGLAGRYRYIFMGKEGWLFDFAETVKRHLGEMPPNFTYAGFVSEFKKYCLLRYARFSIYPSLFEGFGLPILESFSLGTPVVHSASSSMPEVAGEAGHLFAPDSAEELLAAVYRLEAELAENPAALRHACLGRAEAFTWQRMLGTILEETLAHEGTRR